MDAGTDVSIFVKVKVCSMHEKARLSLVEKTWGGGCWLEWSV